MVSSITNNFTNNMVSSSPININNLLDQSAGVVEYANCTSAEG